MDVCTGCTIVWLFSIRTSGVWFRNLSNRFFSMNQERWITSSVVHYDLCACLFTLKHLYINVRMCFLRQENAVFREKMSILENQPKVKGLTFTSFLILPFQRITRLKLLVQVGVSQSRVLNILRGEWVNQSNTSELCLYQNCLFCSRIFWRRWKKILREKRMQY